MDKHRHLLKRLYLSKKGDATLTLMCALSLLLVAFFAVLNSISVKDDKKLRIALGSFVGSLGLLPSGITPEGGSIPLLKSPPILDAQSELASKGISMEALNDLIRDPSGDLLHRNITIKKSTEGLTLHLSGQSFFAPGSADLKTQNIPLLNQISKLIQASSCDILIKGHTDNIPISSNEYASNWELSADRAMNVLRYFLKQGISISRMEAAGYGEYAPLFPNDTPEHRSINRRVEIQLLQKEKEKAVAQSKDINVHGFLFKMRTLMKE